MLVIAVDGGQHSEAAAYDSRRDEFMRAQGYRVLRFWNNEVLANTAGVCEAIRLLDIASGVSRRTTPEAQGKRPMR